MRRFIDSSKVSVVTVTSGFSRELDVEQESGILSFFKSEVKKQKLNYVNVGTGIIIDNYGHVVTRSSIVLGADYHTVSLASGREIDAQFVGHDPETGISVLKLIAEMEFKPASLASSDEISAGSGTVMIGNSLGVFPSIFLGTVNGVMADGMIQVSINLNPGSNGSPIYDFNGQVIGLVVGRLSVAQNLSQPYSAFHYNEPTLAYPVRWIARIAEDIIQYGKVRKGWLGVVGYHDGSKPTIREIKENSPAEDAGLVEGDVIVRYSQRDVNSISELMRLVEWTPPGNRVSIEFLRGEQLIQKEIEIGEKKVQAARPVAATRLSRFSGASERNTAPADVRDLIKKNRSLELRIDYLEKEVGKLKELLEAK